MAAVLLHMRARRTGTVVMLGIGLVGDRRYGANLYGSPKAAVRVFGETLAVEVAGFNIRVLIVEPGAFRTENIFAQPMYAGNKFTDYDKQRTVAKKRFDEIGKVLEASSGPCTFR
ncbi:hypothetical protein BDW22DRAFT_778809 [Trametopsis cervina]|nr:hypothetical protein BDW22DRAFT_778809 [Trametopsis cervina]